MYNSDKTIKGVIWSAKKRVVAQDEARDATAMLSLWLFSLSRLAGPSACELAGGIAATASVGNGRRPQPRFRNKRLRFCPEAVTRASQLTRQSRRKRKRRIPCHSLAEALSGATHTLRLFMAF